MASIEDRLAALERHCGLAVAPEPPRPRDSDRGVSIATIVERGGDMPNAGELQRLRGLVVARFPKLRPVAGWNEAQERLDADHEKSFARAFYALGQIGRLDAPDETRGVSYWIDTAEDVLRANARPSECTAGFLAAVVAHGDIPFTPFESIYSVSLGLIAWGGGRRAAGAWRDVLAGRVPDPFLSARERQARDNPPRWAPGRIVG